MNLAPPEMPLHMEASGEGGHGRNGVYWGRPIPGTSLTAGQFLLLLLRALSFLSMQVPPAGSPAVTSVFRFS